MLHECDGGCGRLTGGDDTTDLCAECADRIEREENMTHKELSTIADNMIGAAQALEKAARELKAQAKAIRGGHTMVGEMDPALWLMHKEGDIKRGAENALRELGALPEGGYLIAKAIQQDGTVVTL